MMGLRLTWSAVMRPASAMAAALPRRPIPGLRPATRLSCRWSSSSSSSSSPSSTRAPEEAISAHDVHRDGMPLPMRPSRPHETVAGARARLRWSSRKRGCLESDLILSTFADRHLASLSDAEVAQYDALLEENDWDIYYWATQAKPVPADMQNSVMTKLQAHARNEARSILRMPDLKAPPSSS